MSVTVVTLGSMCCLNPLLPSEDTMGCKHCHEDVICAIGWMLLNVHFFWGSRILIFIDALFLFFSGTSNGSVLVYNLTSGLLHKELSVHSCEVR